MAVGVAFTACISSDSGGGQAGAGGSGVAGQAGAAGAAGTGGTSTGGSSGTDGGTAGGAPDAEADTLNEASLIDNVGGPCTYDSYPGTCKITAVDTPAADAAACPQTPVTITFDFTPTDPSAPSKYNFPGFADTAVQAMITATGLTVGSTHPCARKEQTAGACTPVLFEFTDVCTP
jgi:hypothetical protein